MDDKSINELIELLREHVEQGEDEKERWDESQYCLIFEHSFKYLRNLDRSYCVMCGKIKQGW